MDDPTICASSASRSSRKGSSRLRLEGSRRPRAEPRDGVSPSRHLAHLRQLSGGEFFEPGDERVESRTLSRRQLV